MGSYIAAFTAALVAGIFLTPLVRWFALRLGTVDRHGGRHVHAGGIPRLGGVAVAAGWCFPLAFDLFGRGTLFQAAPQVLGVVGGGLAICLVGAVDDVRGLRVVHKLIAQILVASFAFHHGFRIDAISLPLVGSLQMGAFALPITVLWIVGITNAVNLIDGLDGLAAGVCFFAGVTGFVVAVLNHSPVVALMLASLLGVLLAFLFFNFNPAKIFMGDSGSYLLGYVLATTSLTGAVQQKASTATALLVPVIALGLPIFDTLFSMFRRFLERRPIFSPDRGHIHHRLLDLGLTHRRAVMLLYGVSILFAACSIALSLGRSWETGIALLSASIVVFTLLRFTGYSEYLTRIGRKTVVYDETTERLRHTVPRLLSTLRNATSEDAIFSALRSGMGSCGLAVIEIHSTASVVRLCENESAKSSRAAFHSSYPIGPSSRARARIDFVWGNDCESFTAVSGVLVQLMVDAVAHRLEACASSLAPRPETIPPEPTFAVRPLPSSTRA